MAPVLVICTGHARWQAGCDDCEVRRIAAVELLLALIAGCEAALDEDRP